MIKTVCVVVLSAAALAFNTLLCFLPVMLLGLIKLCVPLLFIRKASNRSLNAIASFWISVNNLVQKSTSAGEIEVNGVRELKENDWYMLVANHQSWVDILVLQRVFNRRIPFIKFFLKKELIWVPFIGLVWWALDFPFMRRFSKTMLTKHPHLRGKDIEVTRKACEKFKDSPVAIMNFLEGTRFTRQKYAKQKSPYSHLLRPKAGGLSFALSAMGGRIHKLLDITIVYPEGVPSFVDYLGGRVKAVKVYVREITVDESLIGDYQTDEQYKASFQKWVNVLWDEKDRLIHTANQ
ncbi:acyltransferase [Marinomonas mediterranea]|jgi:1-acyl-sn-glycerol-3-phosphate acyltransferase|uniref:Phospholipid/glycerol acyltransferase n=1 Tax=Marinomonas mediterranea (strain ATCC 700492 / JCM 21426 / NBRC 103028 / MMB-1) TaxID=717774 RepID=F2JXB5_MARM1|nr:acyltransferase [Marinomonas mediterranea]ADZ90721.1 phospholipid/glycerol acyltransferase [Marinomonas mediterranea MMB-1]WCN16882.1 acyltransferase [Marinomonas mediterranea MMB-1]